MDKRYSQLELFDEARGREPAKEPDRTSFIFDVNRYQKTIFVLIGFIVTVISSYCVGVEHGKQRASAKSSARFDVAANTPATRPVKTASPVPVPAAAEPRTKLPVLQSNAVKGGKAGSSPAENASGRKFTIQVATYQARSAAERERDRLAKKGIPSMIVKQGAYSVLLVGSFADRAAARSLLSKLRQNYRDCYIRRL